MLSIQVAVEVDLQRERRLVELRFLVSLLDVRWFVGMVPNVQLCDCAAQ